MTEFSIEVTEVSDVEKDVKVTIPADEYSSRMESYYDKLAISANLKGFRKGKVPRNVIIKMYGKRVREDVQGELMDEAYRQAITKHQFRPIAAPEIRPVDYKGEGDFSFSFTVEVLPPVEKVELDSIEVERERVVVADEAVDTELEKRRQAQAQMKTVEGRDVTEKEDWIRVDFEGDMDGEPVAGGKMENELVELGGSQFVPGFEDEMVGKKVGEDFEFTVNFPEDFRVETLKGKPIHFKAKINEITERIVPELDDELAKDLGFDDLNQFRIKVREEMEEEAKRRANGMFREKLWDKIVEANPVPLPQKLIDAETEEIIKRQADEMARMGITPEAIGLTPEAQRERAAKEAENNLRAVIIREKLVADFGVTVTKEDREAYIEDMAGKMNMPAESLKGYYNDEDHAEQLNQVLRHERISVLLEEKVTVTEVDPKPAEEHAHEHTHADGEVHSHAHDHDHDHDHDHGGEDADK